MLSERTEELTRLFAEDREAVLFGSEEDLVGKAMSCAKDDVRREGIAKAGLERVWSGGHDVVSRMADMTRLFS